MGMSGTMSATRLNTYTVMDKVVASRPRWPHPVRGPLGRAPCPFPSPGQGEGAATVVSARSQLHGAPERKLMRK